MCVAPRPFAGAVDVTVGDVHAAYVAYGAVDYHYLAVVAPVYACGEVGECHAEKRIDHYARLAKLLEKLVFGLYGAYVVIYYPHLDPFARLAHEQLAYPGAYAVVVEDVVLQVYVLPCVFDVGHERVKFRLARGEYLHFVTWIVNGSRQGLRQLDLLYALVAEGYSVDVDAAK